MWQEFRCSESGQRLDIFLAQTVPDLSRSRAQKLIDSNDVEVNGEVVKARTLLNLDDVIRVRIPEATPSLQLKAENIPLNILFEDAELLVLDKPAGLVVHPGAGNWEGTMVQALLHHCKDALPSVGGELRPGIVHRIDKNTSGILVVAKSDRAHQHLSQQFKAHSIDRRYIGLAWGPLASATGEFTDPLARDPRERKRIWVNPEGRTAHTRYETLENFSLGNNVSLVLFRAELLTGRTHQIRVHFAFHGYPLLGDSVYDLVNRVGRQQKERGLQAMAKKDPDTFALCRELIERGRQFLHATSLSFTHPVTEERLSFTSPLPPDLETILKALR